MGGYVTTPAKAMRELKEEAEKPPFDASTLISSPAYSTVTSLAYIEAHTGEPSPLQIGQDSSPRARYGF